MISEEMTKEIINELTSIFNEDIERIILYGSVARKEETPESDSYFKEKSDYDDFFIASMSDAKKQLDNAKIFRSFHKMRDYESYVWHKNSLSLS